jgi:hypothetical protein
VSAKRVIAIVGATGAQGAGLARAILGDPASAYAVRALVQADVDDEARLGRALRGAYGAFFENAQVGTVARAARAAKLEHVVWSTLEDAKGEADRLLPGLPTTILLASAYWEDLAPKRGADGRLALALPTGDRKIPWIGAEDIGRCAYGIFKAGRAMIGKTIGVSGEHLSGRELAAALSRALGEPVDYIALRPTEDFSERYRAARDVNAARALNPSLQRFDDWLRDNARRIPV